MIKIQSGCFFARCLSVVLESRICKKKCGITYLVFSSQRLLVEHVTCENVKKESSQRDRSYSRRLCWSLAKKEKKALGISNPTNCVQSLDLWWMGWFFSQLKSCPFSLDTKCWFLFGEYKWAVIILFTKIAVVFAYVDGWIYSGWKRNTYRCFCLWWLSKRGSFDSRLETRTKESAVRAKWDAVWY